MARVNDEHMPSPIEALCAENRKLHQQRTEQLEALKGVQKSLGHIMHPNQRAAVVTAITKAEAAE